MKAMFVKNCCTLHRGANAARIYKKCVLFMINIRY